MRAVVKHSHGHCKGYIRSGSSREGPFLYELSVKIYVNQFYRMYNELTYREITM